MSHHVLIERPDMSRRRTIYYTLQQSATGYRDAFPQPIPIASYINSKACAAEHLLLHIPGPYAVATDEYHSTFSIFFIACGRIIIIIYI
jgi:hypothetical protein